MAEQQAGEPGLTEAQKAYKLYKEFHRVLRFALDDKAYKVFCALEDWSESKGECWHSQVKIAEACNMSERSVRDAINSLEQLGLVTTQETLGKSSHYAPCQATPAKIAALNELGQAQLNERKAKNDPGKICRTTPAKSAAPPRQNLPTNVSNLTYQNKRGGEVLSTIKAPTHAPMSTPPLAIANQEQPAPARAGDSSPISPELQELERSPAIQVYKAAWPAMYARMVKIPGCLVELRKLAATATDLPAFESIIANWLANPHRDASNITKILDAYSKLPSARHGPGPGQSQVQPGANADQQQAPAQAQATYTNVSDRQLEYLIEIARRDIDDPRSSADWKKHCQQNLANNLAEQARRQQARVNSQATPVAQSSYQQPVAPAQESRNYAYVQA